MAREVARGMPIGRAGVAVGWSESNARAVAKLPEFKQLVNKYVTRIDKKTTDVTVHTRRWIDTQMRFVFDWCIQKHAVEKPCEECGAKFERLRDTKHAVKLLEMFGLEQGMFKRQLDVTSRKGEMIDGTQDQIIDKLAQLMERLGIAAMAQLLDRLGGENVTAAMHLNGYEVKKKGNGRVVLQLDDGSSGDTGYGRDSGKPDAQPVRPVSEATVVS